MPARVLMPKLGLTMKEGTVVKWLKKEGDTVEKDEPLVEIETEKISHTIQAPASGVLLKILAPSRTIVPIGRTIGFVGEIGEPLPPVEEAPPAPEKPTVEAKPLAPSTPPSHPTGAPPKASPRAKLLAKEKGVNLAEVVGSGPGGVILEKDVLKHLEEVRYRTQAGLKVKQIIPMSEKRRVIAKRMTSSLQTMAQLTITMEADATALQTFRKKMVEEAEKTGVRITYTDILVKVAAKTLEEFPLFNAVLEDWEIKLIEEINVNVAVATEAGLTVPVIKDADKKSLTEVSLNLRSLVERAKQGTLTVEDVSGGTFTITNLGMFEVDVFTPIINPPQTAILAVGRIVEKPVVSGGAIVAKPMTTLSLTFDHRVIDGDVAARFLQRIKEILQNENMLTEICR
ncbi:dihydrolipoamide acetyltransferase family protein [Candidatus Hecatella orcuttiae]|jgi:pyruvate dehydrogenase E2 component (dihydrolipoamide acetyltransferase)|uniref:dihydrolipoamide acetyltransferase family protein n=1 Tax=Candidatus Hecatella orcuttiae TaxID=1935119 RepID=UPI002868135F|nr:dihydrolipoamide acetyltransferase family protein [Candidatus Hecatella orcuttiae]